MTPVVSELAEQSGAGGARLAVLYKQDPPSCPCEGLEPS